MNDNIPIFQAKDQRLVLKPFAEALVVWPLILLLFFPIIQWKYKMMPNVPLAGVEAMVEDHPSFKISDWFTGTYQGKMGKFFSKLNGFRGFFIRLDNQINFTFFGESKAYNDGIVVGQDNWLFEKVYIKDMNNENQVDVSVLEHQIIKMRELQDLLISRGIYFLFLISPSKATVYGEFLPRKYLKNSFVQETANYVNVRRLIDTYEINYIDAHEFFIKNKETVPYNLFVRGGTHWSNYGAALFGMELVSRIKKDTGLSIGSISYEPIRVDSVPLGTDRDIASLMNVLELNPSSGETAHPTVTAYLPCNGIRPDVLIVGDSFMHIINEFVFDKLFGIRDFYFYYQRNIPNPFTSKDQEILPKNEKLKDAILSKRIIIIEANEIYLHRIGFDFIADAIKILKPYEDRNFLTETKYLFSGFCSKLTQTQVSQLYVSIFGRASEGEGNTYWQSQPDMATTANVMLETDAAKDYFGASLNSNQAFIEHIYLNTLNKTLTEDPNGIAYWVSLLNQGSTRGQVSASLVGVIKDYAPGGPYYNPNDAKTVAAYNQFTNRVTVSDYMAATVHNTPEGWETVTSFSSGLIVTDTPASVITAKMAVDAF